MNNTLAGRMKEYEEVAQGRLARRVPVIVRVDGKAFHTLCRGLDRPFDQKLMDCMEDVAIALCEGIQGAAFAYVQSDEVSVLLTDWDRYDTDSWFDYRTQKVVSVAASIATAEFNRGFKRWFEGTPHERKVGLFDARAANYPRHEVANYFLWRQLDWIRNSVHMVGRAHFSAKQLHRKHLDEVREMLDEAGARWDNLPGRMRLGAVIREVPHEVPVPKSPTTITRMVWAIQKGTPTFSTPKGREWIESFLPDVFWKESAQGDRENL